MIETVTELIDALLLLEANYPVRDVYIEAPDRELLEIGRVVIDSDGDIIIEHVRGDNSCTHGLTSKLRRP